MPPTTMSTRPLRVALIPDSFKGSATAAEAAQAMAEGVERASEAHARPAEISALPFADGGEGTLDAICSAWGVEPRRVTATDALGRPAEARYAASMVDGKLIGLIEAAEANGLPTVSDVPLQPQQATTYGVGTLISAALDAGCEEILLCIGGSATTDGGAGILQALGARLLDSAGQEIGQGGGALQSLARIDTQDLDPRASEVRWRIACDVTNPLLGPDGAASVFGPQKGATPQDVEVLDAALTNFADLLSAEAGRDVRSEPGMGAAGGIPAALVSLFSAEIVPGGVLVAETLGVHRVLEEADVVLTGEGRLDSQSLHGKVVDTVRRLTPEDTPVFVIAGTVDVPAAELQRTGLTAAFSIANGAEPIEELCSAAAGRIAHTAEQVLRVYLSARP
ncbi:glycerate kinase [Nesterenkonia populi]